MKNALIILFGILAGVVVGIGIIASFLFDRHTSPIVNPLASKKEVIGFLPYWLIPNAKEDYSPYVTTLAYFALRVEKDGHIQKLLNPQQEEPGWYSLTSGKVDEMFDTAAKKKVKLSLVIASGDTNSILGLISDPEKHAHNLLSDTKPLLSKYHFSDLNIDVEYTHTASPDSQKKFASFISEVKKGLPRGTTLTVEISPTDPIKNNLISPKLISSSSDNIVLMAYDYHSTTSFVTGPVAPIGGAGVEAEYDTTSAVEKTLANIPAQKLILGIPTYGYQWETLREAPRSSIIPNTGVVASNRRAEELIRDCTNCSVKKDSEGQETYITYFDSDLGNYHTVFFPDKSSTAAKIKLANQFELGGLAVWALGYEGNTILDPLSTYIGK